MIFRRLPKRQSFEPIYERISSKWFLKAKSPCTVIAFTSRLRREGVSSVAAGLARASGAADPGGVLVLDVLPNRRQITKFLNMNGEPVAIKDIKADDADLSEIVSHDNSLGVDVLTLSYSTHTGEEEAEILQSLLERLRTSYRVIFIDAGVLSNSKGVRWLQYSDYRILVVDSTKATREILERQRKELETSGIVLDSVIVNKRKYPIPGFLYWLVR